MSSVFREPDWSEVVAIYGGAFDPPHLGHREAAEGLLRAPGVAGIRVIPTGQPTMKIATTSGEDRLAMARLNFAGIERLVIDDREVRRPEPSYTANTLRELLPVVGAPMAFVIGVDQIEKLPDWNSFPDLLGLCHWIAVERKDSSEPKAQAARERMENGLRRLQTLGVLRTTANPRLFETISAAGPSTALITVQTDARAVSSAEIRKAYAILGEAKNLHPDVESYLKAKGLYGT